MAAKKQAEYDAIVIGMGFSGIGMAVKLQKMGLKFMVLEEAADIGGTWYLNTYPGIACDIPSHLYSFSFEGKADWTHLYSFGDEIEGYLKGVVDKYKLRRHVKFNTHVEHARWDKDIARWRVLTASGQEYIAQYLVSGVGALHIPSVPDFDGRDEFQGPAFHSAEWRHDVDLRGKRVAVIGTGASAIQIVPGIIRDVKELQLYQRTPAWVLPFGNPEFPKAFKVACKLPLFRKAFRLGIYAFQESLGYGMHHWQVALKPLEWWAKRHIHECVADPALREKLTPDYSIGCKRLGKSQRYIPALASPKSKVITERIERFTRNGIVAGGVEHEVDVIIYATGFHVTDSINSLDVTGAKGRALADVWNEEGMQTLRGITIADFPNLFMLLGPNTGLGHNSVIYMIEAQIEYVGQLIDAVQAARANGVQAIVPKRSAQDRFNEEVQSKLADTVWNTGGCASYYRNPRTGMIDTLWPGPTWTYRQAVRKLDLGEYNFVCRRR